MAGMASDGWLVTRGEGGWAARVQGEADLMWVCSFSGLILGEDARCSGSKERADGCSARSFERVPGSCNHVVYIQAAGQGYGQIFSCAVVRSNNSPPLTKCACYSVKFHSRSYLPPT